MKQNDLNPNMKKKRPEMNWKAIASIILFIIAVAFGFFLATYNFTGAFVIGFLLGSGMFITVLWVIESGRE